MKITVGPLHRIPPKKSFLSAGIIKLPFSYKWV